MIGKCNTGGGGKPEEEKTVTAGTSVIEVLPSSGKTMKKVNVNPTPSQSKTVTPSTSQQTVSPDSGKLLSQVIVKAMEDVTPEVTAQTPIITQIAENLGVTITTPSGTNKQILQGNNANLLNINNNAKKEGAYVWKKLTAEGGTFVDYVVDNNESKYPDGGTQGGYWYEKVKLAPDNGISFYDIRPSTDSNYPYSPQTMKIKMDNIPKYFMSSGATVAYASDTNLGGLLTRVEIDSGIIRDSAFRYFFKGLGKTAKAKVILNCESIGEYCFNSIGYSAGYSVSIYIASKCTEILTGTTASHAPFHSADSNNVKLYLEASSAPSGFETYWNNFSNGSGNTLSTMYGVTREAFEAL